MTYNWDLSHIYKSEDEYNSDLEKIQEYTIKLKTYEGRLENLDVLIEFLTLKDQARRVSSKLWVYASLSKDLDLSDPKSAERMAVLSDILSKLNDSYSFFLPELLTFSGEKFRQILRDERFSSYKRFFERLIEKKLHILSKEEEALLSKLGFLFGAPYDLYNSVKMVDIKYPTIHSPEGEEVKITFGTYNLARTHKDRDYRRRAFDALYGTLYNYKNTLGKTLYYEVQKNARLAQIRKFDSALDSALFNFEIPRKVYDNLLCGTIESLPALHKYIFLRKKALNLDKVTPYDLAVPLSFEDKKYTYEECCNLALKYLSILGEEYITVIKKAVTGGWIDVYEAPHKAPGGYQSGCFDTHPYILLNFDNTFNSLSTLVHELGHALHAYFCNNYCDYPNHSVSAFCAEIASITNEILLIKGLIKDSKDDDEKLYYLNKYADLLRNTAYSQMLYADFEKQIHEKVESGLALSAQSLGEIWANLNQKYYGPGFENPFYNKVGWAYILHFYLNFYTFNYALSICAANKAANNILNGDVEGYINFLKSGGKLSPVESVKQLGIDMADKNVVLDLYRDFENTINEIEEILNRKGDLD